MRESDIEKHLVQRVHELGGEIRKVTWPGRRGAPDRFVMLKTGCFWVELKAPGKVAEPHQEREHARLRKMGQRVYVIDSLQGVDEVLNNA